MYCLLLNGREASHNSLGIESAVERSKSFVSSVEIQIDIGHTSGMGETGRMISSTDLPVTVALKSFGTGTQRQNEREKEFLLAAAEQGAAYIGIDKPELISDTGFLQKVVDSGSGVMYTLYFNGVPGDFVEQVEDAYTLLSGALSRPEKGVLRADCLLGGVEEAVELCRSADRLSHIERKLILGEGQYALFSRLLYKRLGSLWGYITPEWIEKCGGVRMPDFPDKEPEVFGIIGYPVGHSKSPSIHNRWIESLGLNAVYIPFLTDDPQAFFQLAEILPVKGFSVTVPHKETVIPLLDRLEPPVKKIGACNTVYRKEGKWIGTNTDYEGFLSPLDTFLKAESIRSALVIGAGGAARTAVHALCDRGVDVKICNRTIEKAERLAEEAGGKAVTPEEVNSSGPYDLLVQTTSVGMEPDVKGDPLPGYRFTGRELVYDIIYTPERTEFLRRAEEEGCRTLGGRQMLRRQAEAQFRIFTGGKNPPDG